MIPNLTIPVLNRYDLLDRMMQSIDYPVKHLLVIDNNPHSHQRIKPPRWVNQMSWLHLPSNLGVAASWNLGIKLFPHDPVWTFASNDMWFRPGDLERLSEAHSGSLTLSQYAPHFHTFAIGENVVSRVGLFDECFYPAYFEDNDMMRRVQFAGLPIVRVDVAPGHDNSSTLYSDPRFTGRNAETFQRNQKLFAHKSAAGDMGFSWSLQSRRLGEWLR